jgi:hypothetical protein
MGYSYYLLSASGIDVIIIPELDCRINIIDPVREGIDLANGNRIIYAEVQNKMLAFQAVGSNCQDEQDISKAVAWYIQTKQHQC